MGRILRQNGLCAQLWQSGCSDFELRILGEDKYVCVAEFPNYLDENQTRDFTRYQEALFNWFRGKPYQESYRERALNGDVNPFDTWDKIKREYGLTNVYDTNMSEVV